jgi:hypothetical protein
VSTRYIACVTILLVLAAPISAPLQAQVPSGDLVFIIAADMRNFAADGEWSKNFSGACEAINEVGPGSFMISPGDLDVRPPSAVREMIDKTIGEDYPWYPVLGNHDPESPSSMQYLRQYSKTLPHVVNRGPKGCEETTYSFDWMDVHFVVLNQYFDGTKDWGLKGDVVPELLEWLEADLAATDKERIFVFGHEPILAIGLWQLDPGHARGLEEASYADQMYEAIDRAIEEGKARGIGEGSSIRQLYRDDEYHIDRWMKYLGMEDQPVTQTLAQFYTEYSADPEARQRYYEKQIYYRGQTRSSFFRVIVGKDEVSVEIYRDDARGGPYELRHQFDLD